MRCQIITLTVLGGLLTLFIAGALTKALAEVPANTPTTSSANSSTEQVLQLRDENGNVRFLLCRPATEDEIAWNPISDPINISPTRSPETAESKPASPTPAQAQAASSATPPPKPAPAVSSRPATSTSQAAPTGQVAPTGQTPKTPPASATASSPTSPAPSAASASSLPFSPNPAQSSVPLSAESGESAQSSQAAPISPARPNSAWLDNCSAPGDQHSRLFADPNDIICAWQFYVPRENTFASREYSGPDPAGHNRLPDMKPAPRPAAPKPQASSGQATQASGATAPISTQNQTGQNQAGAITPAIAGQSPLNPALPANSVNLTGATPGNLPTPVSTGGPAAQLPPAVQTNGQTGGQTGGQIYSPASGQPSQDLLNASPVLPSVGTRPRNGLN